MRARSTRSRRSIRPTADVTLPPRSVWLDARSTQNVENPERGIARFVAEHARALVDLAPEVVASIRLDPALPTPASLESLSASSLVDRRSEAEVAADRHPPIYHNPSPFELASDLDEVWPWWARGDEVRTVVTLHDVIPLIFRDMYLQDDFVRALYMARLGLVRAAHQVLTNSQCTAEDAMEHLGIPESRITVIDSGVSGKLASLVADREDARAVLADQLPEARDGFLLYVGGDDPRKNLDGTIRAYALLPERLRREHQLVIACRLRPHRERELTGLARGLGVGPAGLVLTGFVPDEILAALYRACTLFVFPSLYEGAGLPILEAMSCDAPIAASRTSAIPEILGDTEATFDPADPSEVAEVVAGVLSDEGRLETLRERSRRRVGIYTWRRAAERTLEGYERALSLPVPGRRAPRTKGLAFVTPWPPQPSGIATHSRRLVEELSKLTDVEVIVPGGGAGFDRSLEPRVTLRTDADFEWSRELRGYDRVICALGGSHFHAHAFEALMSGPGVALAHDVRMVGIYLDLHRRRHPDEPYWFEDKLFEMYGDRIPRRDLKLVRFEDLYADYGVFMTQEVQARAERMLLHSHYQAEVLRRDSPRRFAPYEIVPLGVPSVPGSTNGVGVDGDPLVVTYGVVSMKAKRMELLLSAFVRLRETHPGARLLIVGDAAEHERRRIEELAERLGIAGTVGMQGRVDERGYWSILRRADLAVQLRGGINGGEASAAVCDCIAARVPTIVSRIGWFAELPEKVVLPVDPDCSALELSGRMAESIDDPHLRNEVTEAQDAYATENSFDRVALRYAELLDL
jgi:glycosyltransferase involved in cell wall biosynthesis